MISLHLITWVYPNASLPLSYRKPAMTAAVFLVRKLTWGKIETMVYDKREWLEQALVLWSTGCLILVCLHSVDAFYFGICIIPCFPYADNILHWIHHLVHLGLLLLVYRFGEAEYVVNCIRIMKWTRETAGAFSGRCSVLLCLWISACCFRILWGFGVYFCVVFVAPLIREGCWACLSLCACPMSEAYPVVL